MLICYFVVSIINMIMGLLKKQSKVILFASIVFIWLLLWGRTGGHDYYAYYNEYQTARFMDSSQVIYNAIINLCRNIGFTYYQYLAIWSFVLLVVATSLVRKISLNMHLVVALYCLFPLMFDMIQVCNFFANFILLFSVISYILRKKTIAFILLAVAVLVHTSYLFYVPLFFLLDENCEMKKMPSRIIIYATAILSIITFFLGKNLNWLYSILTPYTSDIRLSVYTGTTTNWGFLLYYSLAAISIFALYKSKKIVNNYCKESGAEKEMMLFSNIVFALNVFSLLSLPLCMGNSNFFRYFRNLSLMNAICISNSFTILGGKKIELKHTIALLLYILPMTVFMRLDISSFCMEMINNVFAFSK